jgi:hypothetical protein
MVLVDRKAPDGTYTSIIKFVVKKDVTLTDIYCETFPGYGVCEEGQYIIKMSSKCIPAVGNGQNVDAY